MENLCGTPFDEEASPESDAFNRAKTIKRETSLLWIGFNAGGSVSVGKDFISATPSCTKGDLPPLKPMVIHSVLSGRGFPFLGLVAFVCFDSTSPYCCLTT